MKKKDRLGANPLSAIEQVVIGSNAESTKRVSIPTVTTTSANEISERMTVVFSVEVLERLRNAAYWSRIPLSELVREAAIARLTEMELNNGRMFDHRPNPLKPGRRI